MRLVTVATFEHPYQVELALALLADAGIPARRAGAYLEGLGTFFSGQPRALRVEVPEDYAPEARALLEDSCPDAA